MQSRAHWIPWIPGVLVFCAIAFSQLTTRRVDREASLELPSSPTVGQVPMQSTPTTRPDPSPTPPLRSPTNTPGARPSPNTATVVIVIRDKDGRPCTETQVQLTEQRGARQYFGRLDSNGTAVIRDIIPGGYSFTRFDNCNITDASRRRTDLRLAPGQVVTVQLEWDPRPDAVLLIQLQPPSGFPNNAKMLQIDIVGMWRYYPEIGSDRVVRVTQRTDRTIRLLGFQTSAASSSFIPARFKPDTFGPLQPGEHAATATWTMEAGR